MEYQIFALLCGLGAVAFTAGGSGKAGAAGYWLAGFLAAQLAGGPWPAGIGVPGPIPADPGQIAMLMALGSMLKLKNTRLHGASAFFGGVLAAAWMATLAGQGYPPAFAVVLPLLACGAALAGTVVNKTFATPILLEEALIIVLIASLAAALAPDLIDGWRSAVNLQGAGAVRREAGAGWGVSLIAGLFIILGGVYANWKHK